MARMPPRPRQQTPQVCMRNVFLGGDFEGDSKANAAQPRMPSANTNCGRFRCNTALDGLPFATYWMPESFGSFTPPFYFCVLLTLMWHTALTSSNDVTKLDRYFIKSR